MKKFTVKIDSFNNGKAFDLYFAGEERINKSILVEVFYEKHYHRLVEFVKKRKKPVILDIGAHIGCSSLYFTQIPNATIYSIEPNPNNFACLTKNTQGFKQIKPQNVAIGATNSIRYLKKTGDNQQAETMFGNYPDDIKIPCVTLKKFLEVNKIKHVDAIKIDTEGAEYEIFIMPEFQKIANKIDFIIGESHYDPGIPEMIPPLLKKAGFQTRFLDHINCNRHFRIDFPNGKFYKVEVELKTLFVAKKI